MDRLPQDIIDRIVFYLPGNPEWRFDQEKAPSRAAYATISLMFRAAVERGTFRKLMIYSKDVETFEKVLRPWRRAFLRSLFYHPRLPACDPALVNRVERPADTEKVSRDFGLDLSRLFDALNRLDGLAGVWLDLRGLDHLPSTVRETFGSCRYRLPRARLNLLESNLIPHLDCIRSLTIEMWGRPAASHVYIELASRLKGLSEISIQLDTSEMRYPGRLRADRNDLASSLETFSESTKSISRATIDLGLGFNVTHQTLPMPNLIYPLGYDRLGSSLRTWLQRLTELDLEGVFDGTLFWPHALETDAATPEWPNMKKFDVHLERHTPAGWWYFMPKGKPTYGALPRDPARDPYDQQPPLTDDFEDGLGLESLYEDESWYSDAGVAWESEEEWEEEFEPLGKTAEDYWNLRKFGPIEFKLARNVPNEDVMHPLLESWAKAIGRMPLLEIARLTFPVEFPPDNFELNGRRNFSPDNWRIVYESPGYDDDRWRGDGLGQRRLYLESTHGWRPSKRIMDVLQSLGEKIHPNTELIIWEVDVVYELRELSSGLSRVPTWTRNEFS